MILYIDTFALLYRAYYALPGLQSKKGDPTGGLYGLSTTLFRVIAELEPEHVIACFDRPEQTFRQAADASYKATRDAPEEDMIFQMEAARPLLTSLGVHVVEMAGYEADDLLGTLSFADTARGEQVVIVSCDGDLLQLTAKKGVRVYFLRRGMRDFILHDESSFVKHSGYSPSLVPDFKGLAGDSSDNIPGVAGIGAVYAKRLITTFGTLESIFSALDATSLKEKGFSQRIVNLLSEGRKNAFSSRDLATIHTDVPVSLPHLSSDPWKERIVLSEAEKTLHYYSFESLVPRLRSLIGVSSSNEKEEKIPSSPEDLSLLREASIALWVLDASQTNATAETVYAQTDTSSPAEALSVILSRLKKEGRSAVWEEIERPLIPIVEKMEQQGVRFNREGAEQLSKQYHHTLESITKKIYKLAGKEFNINSPKQLGEVLYDDLGLITKKRGKKSSGIRTTKESALTAIIDSHPIIPLVLEYRHFEKLRSTYIDALPGFLDERGRIHTHLQQNGTTTGRFSSRDPNLQNIPIGGEDGTAIRNLFIAEDGWTLLSVDYSQMELRLAAILSKDTSLIQTFEEGVDVHRHVASLVFSVSQEEVTSEQRGSAKAINFGILYGMGAQALARQIGVSVSEAEQFIHSYVKAFPDLFAYLDAIRKEAKTTGFVTTAFGRTRPMEGIHSSLGFVRAQAERMAINSVVQGTAADIIKQAMVQIDKKLSSMFPNVARMLLQIHDELLFEVRPKSLSAVSKMVISEMESVFPPDKKPLPLTVSARHGSTWGSLTPLS